MKHIKQPGNQSVCVPQKFATNPNAPTPNPAQPTHKHGQDQPADNDSPKTGQQYAPKYSNETTTPANNADKPATK